MFEGEGANAIDEAASERKAKGNMAGKVREVEDFFGSGQRSKWDPNRPFSP